MSCAYDAISTKLWLAAIPIHKQSIGKHKFAQSCRVSASFPINNTTLALEDVKEFV